MTTFGEYFQKLRGISEKTGKTDAACRDMDRFKNSRRTESVIHLDRQDQGWKIIADQELSHSNLLEFAVEMTQAAVARLDEKVKGDTFNPETFSWALDSVHKFHHALLNEARNCGLNVEHLSSWSKARDERKAKSTPT